MTAGDCEQDALLAGCDLAATGLWKIERNETYGRFMVAAKDIQPGQLILAEEPIMWGPNTTNRNLVCLGCFRHITGETRCPKCNLPVCSVACADTSPHALLECPHFAAHRNRTSPGAEDVPYPSILALRILLLRNLRPRAHSTFKQLATLLDQWKTTAGWLEGQAETVALIRERLDLHTFQEEEILEVSAALSTNAFAKYLEPLETGCGPGTPTNVVGTSIRVVFLLAAMPAHSCHPNAEQAIHGLSEGLRLELRATRMIPEGSQIQISYTDLLAPTPVRQFELMNSKLFLCACPRCEDPTEFGTITSGVKCSSCLRAHKEPGILLPVEKQDVWRCGKCEATIPNSKVLNLLFKIYEQMEALLNNPLEGPPGLEAFLTKFSRVLGEGNGLLQRVRYSLCGQYGRLPGFQLSDLDPIKVDRKRQLCEAMLATLDKLQPGRSSRRAMILYELHISLLVTGRSQGDKKMLQRSVACLKEALDLLKDEPPASFGGQLFIGGSASLPQVVKFVSEL